MPGNAVEFTGGSGSLSVGGSGSLSVGGSPRGGVASGAGGTDSTSLPLVPIGGLLAGLTLIGAGALSRRRV